MHPKFVSVEDHGITLKVTTDEGHIMELSKVGTSITQGSDEDTVFITTSSGIVVSAMFNTVTTPSGSANAPALIATLQAYLD